MSLGQWIVGVQTLTTDDIPEKYAAPNNMITVDFENWKTICETANGVVSLQARVPKDGQPAAVDMMDPRFHFWLNALAQKGPGWAEFGCIDFWVRWTKSVC